MLNRSKMVVILNWLALIGHDPDLRVLKRALSIPNIIVPPCSSGPDPKCTERQSYQTRQIK